MKTNSSPAPVGASKPIDWFIKQLTQRNYYVAKTYYQRKLYQSDLRAAQPPLLIYQMGKVGSSTVQKSLEALNLDMPIYHPHFLTQDFTNIYEQKRRQLFGTKQAGDLKHIWQCQYLSQQLKKGLNGKRWKVVTLVREPIARNISAFFETLGVERIDDLRYRVKADTKSLYHFDLTISLEDTRELVQLFLNEFDHDTPVVFFDREFKAVLDVDIFASEFPKDKGYKVYAGKAVDVLLLRLENLNQCASEAFKEFLNVDNFALINTNIGDDKIYAPIYKKLKNSIVLPDSYMDEIYSSKYMQHFYSEEEISRFRVKWGTSSV